MDKELEKLKLYSCLLIYFVAFMVGIGLYGKEGILITIFLSATSFSIMFD